MGIYGKWETYKIVYILRCPQCFANKGVAFVEAGDRAHAIGVFQQQYAGQFHTIESCEKVF